MLASVVINRAAKTLLDETGVLWSSTELLDYLNTAITAIIAFKPDVYVLTATFTLTNSQAKQTLPSGGLQLLEVTRNLSPSLTAIRQIERNHLNNSNEGWANTAGTPSHFMYDGRNDKIFYIYPQPASGTNQVEIVYSAVPTRLTATTDTLPIDDIYENPLFYYVIGMSYLKNAKRGDLSKSNLYFSLFASGIGARQNVEYTYDPTTPHENPQGNNEIKGPNQ